MPNAPEPDDADSLEPLLRQSTVDETAPRSVLSSALARLRARKIAVAGFNELLESVRGVVVSFGEMLQGTRPRG